MQKINLNNTWTDFTIDSYHMFSDDSYIDGEIYNYNRENDTDYNYNDFDWEYKKEEIVKNLAELSISILLHEVKGDVISEMKYVSSQSPYEYNFTTDSYDMEIDYNKEKLGAFIKENEGGFIEKVKHDTTARDGYRPYYEYDEMYNDDRARLAYYLNANMNVEEYEGEMYNGLYDVFADSITMTKK